MGYLDFDYGQGKRKRKDSSFDFGTSIYSNNKKVKYERVPVGREQKKEVLYRQKDKCAWPSCRIHFHRDGVTPHFDHIRRVEKGGTSTINNLQALCPNHHQKKTDKENLKEVEKRKRKAKVKSDNPLYASGGIFSSPKLPKSSWRL
jgi:5-methylcytosine-specific restriction endonuclease McrA